MGLLKSFIAQQLGARSSGKASGHTPVSVSAESHATALIAEWINQGLPAPAPHIVKQAVVRAYARRHRTRIFVETGTYFGDMVDAMKCDFDRVYSIELSEKLHARAAQRFAADPRIELIQGDSGSVLKSVMAKLNEPALFWLDGHWSAGVTARGERDTPVREELDAILSNAKVPHVILIDDARCFGHDAGYPTLDELRAQVHALAPHLTMTIDVDIIRITPVVETSS